MTALIIINYDRSVSQIINAQRKCLIRVHSGQKTFSNASNGSNDHQKDYRLQLRSFEIICGGQLNIVSWHIAGYNKSTTAVFVAFFMVCYPNLNSYTAVRVCKKWADSLRVGRPSYITQLAIEPRAAAWRCAYAGQGNDANEITEGF